MMGPPQPMVPGYGPPTQFQRKKKSEAQQYWEIRDTMTPAEEAEYRRAKTEKKLADKEKKLAEAEERKAKEGKKPVKRKAKETRDEKNRRKAKEILEARGGPSQFE